jgi:xanthine dehydrogenase YagS FAD-binding subunit
MQDFAFGRAGSAASAVQTVAARPHATFIAGGTSLVDLMKEGVEHPDALIDINGLPLGKVERHEGGLRIGALVRNSDLAHHADVLAMYPVLSQALLSGASPQLRNMATVGGNLLQRVRCPYFRDTAFERCNKRAPGTGCGAIEGHHRTHAILGTSDQCIATHPSDMCVALAMLDAVVQVHGPHGLRSIPFAALYVLPGQHPEKEHTLAHGELITAVDLPALPMARRSHYLKVRDRASYEFALTSAAVSLEVVGGTVRAARIAMGGVGTVPWRCRQAEAALLGRVVSRESFERAADAELAAARTHKDNAFKLTLARRTLVRALEELKTGGRA